MIARPAAAARSAACRSSAVPSPARRRAGCTVSVSHTRSRFSRSGNSAWYQAATAPSASAGTYQASRGGSKDPARSRSVNIASDTGGSNGSSAAIAATWVS